MTKLVKDMRIVGLNAKDIFIQFRTGYDWTQEVISYKSFEDLMRRDYPSYWSEYEASETDVSPESFFYQYGEDGKDTYIFKA